MDISATGCLSKLGMEDPALIHQCQTKSVNDSVDELNIKPFSSESYSIYPSLNPTGRPIETSQPSIQKPAKKLTPKAAAVSYSSSNLISFENYLNSASASSPNFYSNMNCTMKPKDHELMSRGSINFSPLISQGSNENLYDTLAFGTEGSKRVCTASRSPSKVQEHVLAERKHRERLTQRFISLSSLIPDLRKLEKASILGGAISYIKQLQERVKTLEKEAEKKPVESVFCVKRSFLSGDDDTSSSNENFDSSSSKAFPKIEVRVSDMDVLIRIHSKQHNGFLPKILSEMEKLHLTIINAVAMPFGNTTIDTTVIAQMDAEICTTAKDLVKNLGSAILSII